MNHTPELIVMLTHHDRTVDNALEVFEAAKDTPARYWGFKEEGLPFSRMKELVTRMKEAGKITCLEVVAYTEEECLRGAQMGVDCGFDILMGTLYFDSIRDLAMEHGLKYYPFVGQITGRPSVLTGTIEGMTDEANRLAREKGLEGFDLLGYRYTGDAPRLNREFVEKVDAKVCLAGSISDFKRLDEVKEANPWAYTIGSAFFENKFGNVSFGEQIRIVCDYMNR